MFYKPQLLQTLKREQRKILQQSGLEKEFRKLQRRIKKEIQGAEIYLYRDITPTSLGEFVYILEILRGDDFLAQIVAADIEDLIKTTEDWLDE